MSSDEKLVVINHQLENINVALGLIDQEEVICCIKDRLFSDKKFNNELNRNQQLMNIRHSLLRTN